MPIRWDTIQRTATRTWEGEGTEFRRFAHRIVTTAGFSASGALHSTRHFIRHLCEPHSCQRLQQVHQGYESARHALTWPARHGLSAQCHRTPSFHHPSHTMPLRARPAPENPIDDSSHPRAETGCIYTRLELQTTLEYGLPFWRSAAPVADHNTDASPPRRGYQKKPNSTSFLWIQGL